MLYSRESCTGDKKRPHFSLWFGNFFEPYFSDRKKVAEGMREIADMGFNSIILDSKLWEDFTRFFETGEASPYVAMQQYMIEEAKKCGLGINFLTLFYNGDNLYPHIRDSAPDLLHPVTGRDGKPFRGYRHWDLAQTEAMAVHTERLYRLLAKDAASKAVDETGVERTPCYFYHSPGVMPSFDEDGKRVYVNWLRNRYQENIDALNREYGAEWASFDAPDMRDLWPEMTREDYRNGGARMRMHRDNMLFRQEIMESFYRELTVRVRKRLPGIYLYDCVSQWKYLLPDWVEISERGLDLWRLGKYLDCPSFYTLPADAYGETNGYAVSCEMAVLRSACRQEDLTGGLFLGRYLYNDIYNTVTPAEMMASALGAGATDLFFYGYSGLDDGGNFGKWSEDRKCSVRQGLDWFARVRELTGKRVKKKQAAILFPYASFTMDNRRLNEEDFRAGRNDCLGYYQQLADMGINADFVTPEQVRDGALEGYALVILPSNPLYRYLPDGPMEEMLRAYVQAGGHMVAGASCGLFDALGITAQDHPEDSIFWKEKITEFSIRFKAFPHAVPEAVYGQDKATALGRVVMGKGTIYTAGFDMGACYCERRHKPVAVVYGRENHYPLTVLDETPMEMWIREIGMDSYQRRGVERIPFENGLLLINHTSYDCYLPVSTQGISTFAGFDGRVLPGHHSVFLPRDNMA